MSDFLPLFPLRVVVFPKEDLNLHIFEPRYKQLIEECEHTGMTFGISPFVDDTLKPIGTEIKLKRIVRKYPDGRMDVETKAMGHYQIIRFMRQLEDKMYSGAQVERMEYSEDPDPEMRRRIHELLGALFKVLDIDKPLPTEEELLTYDVAHKVGMSLEQEYHFLTLLFEKDRQSFLLKHLERILPLAKEMERLRDKIQMNGHFRNIIPPNISDF